VESVAKSLVAATSSSRFTEPNFWRDPASGNGFRSGRIPSPGWLPLRIFRLCRWLAGNQPDAAARSAEVKRGHDAGEVDRYNMQRVVSLNRKYSRQILSEAAADVKARSRGWRAAQRRHRFQRGDKSPLSRRLSPGCRSAYYSRWRDLSIARANFQSIRLAFAVISTVPAVICGVIGMLLVTGTTLQRAVIHGAIMAIGVADG